MGLGLGFCTSLAGRGSGAWLEFTALWLFLLSGTHRGQIRGMARVHCAVAIPALQGPGGGGWDGGGSGVWPGLWLFSSFPSGWTII